MKRVAFYRRSGDQSTPLAGMKERVVWRLSKGPATGTELAEIFGITRVQMNHIASKWHKNAKTAQIAASSWRERRYLICRIATPQFMGGKTHL